LKSFRELLVSHRLFVITECHRCKRYKEQEIALIWIIELLHMSRKERQI